MITMLEVSKIHSGYDNIEVLHDVSIQVDDGEIVSVIGANGAGKSTLLKTICGLLPCKKGTIKLHESVLNNLHPSERVRKGIVLVPEGRGIFTDMTVYENLLMGAYCRKDGEKIKEDIEDVFKRFPNLNARRTNPAGVLSGGEQQMLAIGRGLVGRPKLMILDEPSLGLAPLLVRAISELLCILNGEGVTILLVEQNAKQALKISKHAFVMANGQIKLAGKAQELMEDPMVQKAYLGGH
jgi:branched-chain amino acid transport system ATP-binding protein